MQTKDCDSYIYKYLCSRYMKDVFVSFDITFHGHFVDLETDKLKRSTAVLKELDRPRCNSLSSCRSSQDHHLAPHSVRTPLW